MAVRTGRFRRRSFFWCSRRRGYTLVFFAMMLFGIMAMAALLIDIGFARLTQQQLRVAADSAAVEGLRGEGTLVYNVRRDVARDFIHWHFDDDLDSTGRYPADDDGAFDTGSGLSGAGPFVQFSGGAGDPSLVASQLMAVDPANPVYKPVALDGTPSAAGSFQVALRRGPTDTPDADLFANGPSVPYLFARGSLTNRELIESGITVRGTATAEFRPAKSIGFAVTTDMPGLASFALPATGGVIDASAPYFFTIDSSNAMPVVIGRSLPDASGLPADGFTENGYAPVYATLSTNSVRIVGFVRASVAVTGGAATVTLATGQNSSRNASVVICYATNDSVTAAEMTEIVVLNQTLPGVLQAIVLRESSE
ncbi:MAG: pilus assembly protein TadG-related protein [Pirellulaceae bacterium]